MIGWLSGRARTTRMASGVSLTTSSTFIGVGWRSSCGGAAGCAGRWGSNVLKVLRLDDEVAAADCSGRLLLMMLTISRRRWLSLRSSDN